MKYARIIGIILGIILFLYGAGAVANSFINPVKTTGQWYLGVAGVMFAGVTTSFGSYKFLIQSKTDIQDLDTNFPPYPVKPIPLPIPTPEPVPEEIDTMDDPMIHLENVQLADYECLNHLTKRFSTVGDSEAVEHCKKLQERMFELYYGKKVVEPITS